MKTKICLILIVAFSLIAWVRNDFDFVLVDTPPIIPRDDATMLASVLDETVLVVRPSGAHRWALTAALDKLGQARATVIGMVLNEVK